jgi:hypothetical protein
VSATFFLPYVILPVDFGQRFGLYFGLNAVLPHQRFSRLLMFAPVIINANVAPAMPVNAIVRVEGMRD